jgi:hypothetical protein
MGFREQMQIHLLCFPSKDVSVQCIQYVRSDRQVPEAQNMTDSEEMEVKAFQLPETNCRVSEFLTDIREHFKGGCRGKGGGRSKGKSKSRG